MKKYSGNIEDIHPHNVLFAWTSEYDYEMVRYLLLEGMPGVEYGDYVVAEGSHCSCYDFDQTEWTAMQYTPEELGKLARTDAYSDVTNMWEGGPFWKMVRDYLN